MIEFNQDISLQGRNYMILAGHHSEIKKFTIDKRVIDLAKVIQERFPNRETIDKAYLFYSRKFPNADYESKIGYLLTNIISYCCKNYSWKLKIERNCKEFPLKLELPEEMLTQKNSNSYDAVPYIKVVQFDNQDIGTIPNLVFIDELPVMIFPRLAKWNKKEDILKYKKLGKIIKFTFGQNPALILCEDMNRFIKKGGPIEKYKFKKMKGPVRQLYQEHGILTTYFSRTRDQIYGIAKNLEAQIAEEEKLRKMPQE